MRRALLVAVAALSAVSCATIMHGTNQNVGISSTPTAARVTVDNQPRGVTPLVLELRRKDNHIVKIEMDGYQPFETTLTRKVSGWVWGNLVFGGIPGLAVDAITGGLYALTPEQVQGQLIQRTGSRGTRERDGLYVFLVRDVNLDWRRIGQLEPVEPRR